MENIKKLGDQKTFVPYLVNLVLQQSYCAVDIDYERWVGVKSWSILYKKYLTCWVHIYVLIERIFMSHKMVEMEAQCFTHSKIV